MQQKLLLVGKLICSDCDAGGAGFAGGAGDYNKREAILYQIWYYQTKVELGEERRREEPRKEEPRKELGEE